MRVSRKSLMSNQNKNHNQLRKQIKMPHKKLNHKNQLKRVKNRSNQFHQIIVVQLRKEGDALHLTKNVISPKTVQFQSRNRLANLPHHPLRKNRIKKETRNLMINKKIKMKNWHRFKMHKLARRHHLQTMKLKT